MFFSKKEDKYYGTIIFQLILCFVCCCTILLFYQYYSTQLENRKNEVLNDYYKIVLYNSVVRLERVIQKFPLNQRDNVIINIDDTNIQTCYETQCIKSDLFELASIIDQFIPHYINYKIEVNKRLLHYNNKIQNYCFEKIYHINKHNQIIVTLSLDPKYLNRIRAQIYMPFGIIVICLIFLFMLVIIATRSIYKSNKKFYSSYYKDLYDAELEKAEKNFKFLLLEKENSLMKKIWNLEYKEEKDIELNHLFAQEINKLAMIIQKADGLNVADSVSNTILPCSLILYFLDNKQEKISIKDLVEIFSKRFIKSEENISFDFVSDEGNINFASKASLYQIIYSVLIYISFILKEQSSNLRYNIKLDIMNKQEGLCLLFKFDGNPMQNEEELFTYSTGFSKRHINPFLLSINQIFFVLREDSYECSVGRNKTNFIKIVKKNIANSVVKLQSNIIKLPIRKE